MAEPNLPQNQLDSLALRTATAAAIGDSIVIGNTLTRYWSPAVLGMGSNFVDLPISGGSALVSAAINVAGCASFCLVMARTVNNAAGDVAEVMDLYHTYGHSNGSYENLDVSLTNRRRMFTQLAIPGALGAPPRTDIFSCTFNNGVLQAGGWGSGVSFIGQNVKVAIRRTAVSNPNQSYSCELWGAQF